jgi:MscS family membrane protein
MITAGQRNPGDARSLLILARLEELAFLSVLRRCIREEDSGGTVCEAMTAYAHQRVSEKRVAMAAQHKCVNHLERAAVLTLFLLFCPAVWPQASTRKPATTEAQPEAPKDTLGRNTPRGTVLGFLSAARKGNAQIAALYLNTPLRGASAEDLARQLAVVLDRRLPARLNLLSDEPEGSLPDPLRPDEDIVGTITTANGDLDILVERVDRGKAGKIWLFSRTTLNSIPNVFQELNTPAVEKLLPEFLVKTRVATVPLFELLAFFVGLPVLYLLAGLLNRIISLGVGTLRRRLRRNLDLQNPQVLPPPIRLLLLAITIRWLLSRVGLPLLARQFWSTTAQIITIGGCVWLLMLLSRWGEHYLVGRRPGLSGSASVLRLFRRLIDGLALFAGLLFTLYRFGINPTAALAGLGVGGIAIALAAQKTLENVIAGISLIADQAVRAGDTLKLGDIVGTVEEVGLRSTRIRTPDRTVVSLPNGQIANMSLEALSLRDKFWFHPLLSLRYETTPVQLRAVITGIRKLLTEHSNVDSLSVRVRLVRFGTFSLDVDVIAYVSARDWDGFLQIQEELLLGAMDIVQKAGTEIAFPSQTMYLSAHSSDKLARLTLAYSREPGADAHYDERNVPSFG